MTINKKDFICLLPYESRVLTECGRTNCNKCGWNAEESERRRNYIETHGLTKNEKGLFRLIKAKDIKNEDTTRKMERWRSQHK